MNHLELTIADLRAARNRADMLIAGLLEFQAGCDGNATEPTAVAPVAPPEKLATEGQRIESKTRVPRGTAKQAKAHKNAPKGRAVALKLFKVAESLAEPFTPADLAAAAKADRKQCENFIVHRVVKKMFTRNEPGQYSRGPKFPYTVEVIKPRTPESLTRPQPMPIKTRKLGERPGLVPMPREEARPAAAERTTTPGPIALPTVAAHEKPATLGGVMKMIIRTAEEFTGEQLRRVIQSDKDYCKLLEQSPTGFNGNLIYWSNQGFLSKDGDGALEALFTVTKAGKEWFAK